MKKVSDLIRHKGHQVHRIQTNTAVADTARAFLDCGVSSFLVCDGEDVVGIFTKNDLIRRSVADPDGFGQRPVAESMSTDLLTSTPEADLDDVFEEMVRRGVRHVPVLDGKLAVGMITPIDVLLYQKHVIDFENQELMRYINGSY